MADEAEYFRRFLPQLMGLDFGRVPWFSLPGKCRRCIAPGDSGTGCACGQGWGRAACRLARGQVIREGTSHFLLTAPDGPPWPGVEPPPVAPMAAQPEKKATAARRPVKAAPPAKPATPPEAPKLESTVPRTFVRKGWI
jgi:hypothetical protein